MAWIPIRYRDFYDVPRAFIVEHDGSVFFFDGGFDEGLDEYPAQYRVYQLDAGRAADLEHGSWERLEMSGPLIGEIPVSEVTFDETLRNAVDDTLFQRVKKRQP